MRFSNYAYLDAPTLRIPAIEPVRDEADIVAELHSLTSRIYELLADLHAARRVRADSANKVYPRKRWRWL